MEAAVTISRSLPILFSYIAVLTRGLWRMGDAKGSPVSTCAPLCVRLIDGPQVLPFHLMAHRNPARDTSGLG